MKGYKHSKEVFPKNSIVMRPSLKTTPDPRNTWKALYKMKEEEEEEEERQDSGGSKTVIIKCSYHVTPGRVLLLYY